VSSKPVRAQTTFYTVEISLQESETVTVISRRCGSPSEQLR